jgi:2-dehydro-3-deoxyphosphogluconate aldolase/(4S)-4-hydroxy-2-oxoglutarate aldolase
MKIAEDALKHVQRTRIIAILRGQLLGRELEIGAALVEGGITSIEVSAVTLDYAKIIRLLQRTFGERASIGVGTVLTEGELHAAADAGAAFVVSPNTNRVIIAESRRLGLASFPGAYTATEIIQAMDSGADAVKVFPAVSLRPDYIKALRGPLPHARLVPTGGIDLSNISSFLRAGSFAVGVGSELVGKADMEAHEQSVLARKARAFAQVASEAMHG